MEDGSVNSFICLASKQITKEAFERAEEEGRPFLLKDFVGKGFLSWWCDEVLRRRGGEVIHFVEVCGITGKRGLTESTMEVFADECQKLSDRQRFAYFQGDFMATEDAEVMRLLHDNLPEPLPRGEQDFFCIWPRKIAPAPMLQIAGAGARTQLVRSGLEAPQWILCLTGKMRLKLFPERCEAGRLAPLRPFREPMGVFDEDGRPLFTVCEHLLSDVDLFAAEMAESPITHLDSFGPDLQRFPEASQLPKALEVLLKPGEMACLPAGGWVQSYADEASWSLQSFYANSRGLNRILEAVLAHAGQKEEIFGYSSLPPQAKVEAALSAALGRGHGGFSGGRSVLARLRSLDRENTKAQQETFGGDSCAVCGRPARTRCGRCRELLLCSAECQQRCWPEHRKSCVPAKKVIAA